MCQTLGFYSAFVKKQILKFDTSTNSVLKSPVSTRPYEATFDEYPRSWCGKDSSYYSHYLKLFIPHTVSVCVKFREAIPHGFKVSVMLDRHLSGFGPGWTRWKYLRFLNGWTTNEMTPYHSTICCNIIPTSTQVHQLLQIFANSLW